MRRPWVLAFVVLAVACALPGASPRAADSPHVVGPDPISIGRFLVNYGGCNDCHTPHWDERHLAIPESRRLTGNPEGFTGPWGTSYAANLRLVIAGLSEDQWLALVRNHRNVGHPPMPWWNVQVLGLNEQRAIYAYIHSLGPAGKPAPAYQPPQH